MSGKFVANHHSLPGTYGAWMERTRNLHYEDDPDRHYYNTGLGQLDNDDSGDSDDDDDDPRLDLTQVQPSLEPAGPIINSFPLDEHYTPGVGGDPPSGNWLIGPGTNVAAIDYEAETSPPPPRTYDVRKFRANNDSEGSSSSSEDDEDCESSSSETTEGPESGERYEWQQMLGNVLQGDVFKTEKSRLISTTNEDDAVAQRKRLADDIWLAVRAYTRGREIDQERIRLDQARSAIHGIVQDVLAFRVTDGSDFASAAAQVGALLGRLAWAKSLYPSWRALLQAKPEFADKEFTIRKESLQSWLTITQRLRVQMSILQKWTGSENLDVEQPGTEKVETEMPDTGTGNQQRHRQIEDTSTFVERILKEDSFTGTFQKRTITDISPLIHGAKEVLTTNHRTFQELNLPAFSDDLNSLAAFPITLMLAALKLRLAYVTRVNKNKDDPSVVLIDQLTDDFRACLTLATYMKKEFTQLNMPEPENGWNPPDLAHVMSEYEAVLINALKFFFKLLAWKLKSGGKTVYLKETDIVDHEWKFLSATTEMIEGGEVLVAEHFSMLTHRLISRLGAYFDENIEVLQRRNMSLAETSRWFNQTLDNVRQRHRKLLRFGMNMIQRFENAAEYTLEDIDFNAFVAGLAETGHFLIYTGSTEQQGLYMVGSPRLHDRPHQVKAILTRCYPNARSAASVSANGDLASETLHENGQVPKATEDPCYVLILTPREPFIWTGDIMNFEYQHGPLDTRERRVRIIADGPLGRLARAKQRLYDYFPAFQSCVAVEALAHMGGVNRETKKIKSVQFRLAQNILCDVVPRVREVFRSMKGGEGLLANFFSFASDTGQRTLKSLDTKFHARLVPLLLQFANNWVTFICDDCAPADPRTFKWAVQALEFVHQTTREDNITTIKSDEFGQLRSGVASCMALLISHFDVLGARSSFAARERAAKVDSANKIDRRAAEHSLGEMDRDAVGIADGVITSTASAKVLHLIKDLEAQRQEIESQMSLVGHVLDKERPEDAGLLFLASSNSNISIRWQQGRFIGGGTFGQVYLGVKLDSGDLMAVKEIRIQDLASAPHLIKQVRDEMSVMEMLRHPNIVEYYGIEVHRERVYIFEEYCQGGSLASLLEHGRIEDEIVLKLYTLQLLDGLIYLHSKGIVHRDIKPDNILLDHNGVIKYVDFGAAKVLGKEMRTLAARSRMGNVPGDPVANSLTGTPSYMAPEVIKGEHRGPPGAMDIWGLGCVVLECATGKRPWGGLDNEWAIMFQIGIAAKPPPLPDESQLSAEGIDFIRQCLTIEATKRPTAVDLMDKHPWITQFREELAQTYENELGDQLPSAQAKHGPETLDVVAEEAEEDNHNVVS